MSWYFLLTGKGRRTFKLFHVASVDILNLSLISAFRGGSFIISVLKQTHTYFEIIPGNAFDQLYNPIDVQVLG